MKDSVWICFKGCRCVFRLVEKFGIAALTGSACVALLGIATFSCKGRTDLWTLQMQKCMRVPVSHSLTGIRSCILIFIQGNMVYRYCFKLHFSTMNEFGHCTLEDFVCVNWPFMCFPFSRCFKVGMEPGGREGAGGSAMFPRLSLVLHLAPKSNKPRYESSPKWNDPTNNEPNHTAPWIAHLPGRVWEEIT